MKQLAQKISGVETTKLVFARGTRRVLDLPALSLTARRTGIIGRNGSGKTTLLRVLAGLQVADQGRALVCGVDVARDRRAAVSAVGILFQNPDHQIIFPTVEEEIGFGLSQAGHDAARVAAAVASVLARFERRDWGPRRVYDLSQGQRHLVCLMAVLAMAPAVILLDEPFAGLDIPTTRALNAVLEALEQQVVLVTHDPERLRRFDEVLWIDQGTLHLRGTPDQVLPEFLHAMNGEGADDLVDL